MAINKKQAGVIVAGVAAVALIGGGIWWAVGSNDSSAEAAGTTEEQVEAATTFDLTSQNAKDRPHIDPVDEAVAALEESGFEPIEPGKLTVAISPWAAPLGVLASDDNTTVIGTEADFGSLIADGLGLEYHPVAVDWADWPLGVQSGKYDLVASNVTVTEERKELFDFASYRQDLLGFYVQADSDIDEISEPADVAGLKIVVGSGTNQEKILLAWNEELEADGEKPAELVYYDDQAAADLALSSGRVDATLGPNATAAYRAAATGESKLVGTLDGGWPETAPIAAGTAKGNGLVEPVQLVLQSIIDDGTYDEVLERWALTSEGVDASEVNPPGLPKAE
ncbi:ABC transporter substrate-binding protein [Agromyces endophyticus]|uniref:ABC transporter substrate-binding protein n=1 Tax=Agromyces sp. H17E-10 TaxID=2932244 RepID=UPI001FCF7BE7|nr:ABC transporter substrate-binding protein [Agromyces sp. H17E-10]UOQ90485.1 ABC transporter substrate-binding protein [Agromyces sp. H17E-10]